MSRVSVSNDIDDEFTNWNIKGHEIELLKRMWNSTLICCFNYECNKFATIVTNLMSGFHLFACRSFEGYSCQVFGSILIRIEYIGIQEQIFRTIVTRFGVFNQSNPILKLNGRETCEVEFIFKNFFGKLKISYFFCQKTYIFVKSRNFWELIRVLPSFSLDFGSIQPQLRVGLVKNHSLSNWHNKTQDVFVRIICFNLLAFNVHFI